jgi:hypothetical protein
MSLRSVGPFLGILAGCGAPAPTGVVVWAPPGLADAFGDFVAYLPGEARLEISADPDADAAEATGTRKARRVASEALHLAVTDSLGCEECFEIAPAEGHVAVRGGGVLGAQYGVTAVLEGVGYRFHHPFAPTAGADLGAPLPAGLTGERHTPEVDTRGLHLHTLHPIEGLDAFWTPGDDNAERAAVILDWAVKNRADLVQWVALDDITHRPGALEPWRAHTEEIVARAHTRGLRAGLGMQLYGFSNLQQAWDLVDDESLSTAEKRAEMDARLAEVSGLGFDRFNLSFGEFFSADPAVFVAAVDEAYAAMQAAEPGVDVVNTIHVGDAPEQRVVWEGEDMIYYFLALYADPAMVPFVHTVMYYNLLDDAGGTYHHEDFAEHRAVLEERIAAGLPVAYFPETSYWVAFDNSVPQYLPLYMLSRDLDLEHLAGFGRLPEHTLFSTGWEWGYWQNDVASLRLSYERGGGWAEAVEWMYTPWGADGAEVAAAVVALAEAQRRAHLQERLTPWLSGRDAVMDAGFALGIVAAPERETAAVLAAASAEERAAFRAGPLADLARHAAETAALADTVAAVAGRRAGDRYFAELDDSFTVTAARVAYAAALWDALLDGVEGADPAPALAAADAAYAQAAGAVERRRAGMFHPDSALLVAAEWPNPTIYQYGYLHMSDTLCFWDKERAEVERALGRSTALPPTCF